MRDLLDDIDGWRAQGRRVAVARVVDLQGSGPREPGAAMVVSADGQVRGSVSGGCVEGAVVEAALDALDSGRSALVSFGYSDEDALAVGLTCGGMIHLFIDPQIADPGGEVAGPEGIYPRLAAAVRAGRAAVLATVVGGPGLGSSLLVVPGPAGAPVAWRPASGTPVPGTSVSGKPVSGTPVSGTPVSGTLGDAELDRVVARDAEGELAMGATRVRRYGPAGEAGRDEVSVFIESFVPPARLIIFGAVDFAGALARVAKVLGYRVTLCDARPVFATRERFPMVDELVVDWPHRLLAKIGPELTERDAVCVLTHEARFDVPALVAALATPVGYLGAMGSRRTHADRLRRLREAGVDEAGLARLYAPIGLDLGALTPEETAVSICAEIVAVARRTLRPVGSLTAGQGPIHRRAESGPAGPA